MVVSMYIQQSKLVLIPCVFKNSVVLENMAGRWAVSDRKFQYLRVTSSFEAHMAVLILFSKFDISNKKCGYSDQLSLEGTGVVLFTLLPTHSLSQCVLLLLLLLLGSVAFWGPVDLVLVLRQPCWIISSQAPWHWKVLIRGTGNCSAETPQLSGWQCCVSGRLVYLFSWPDTFLLHKIAGFMCKNCFG